MNDYRQYQRVRLVLAIGMLIGVSASLLFGGYEVDSRAKIWLACLFGGVFAGVLGEWQTRRKELMEARNRPSFDDWLAAKRREKPKPYDKNESDGPIVDV